MNETAQAFQHIVELTGESLFNLFLLALGFYAGIAVFSVTLKFLKFRK